MKNLNMCTTIEKTLFWPPYDVVIPASYGAVARVVHQAVDGVVDGVLYQALYLIGQDPVYEDLPHPKLELYLGSVRRG